MARLLRITPFALWTTAAVGFCALFAAWPLGTMLLETVVGPEGGVDLSPWGQLLASEYDRNTMVRSLLLGACSLIVAFVFGFGHAWLCVRTDMPGATFLGPLGILPLTIPPIFVAMAASDFFETRGFLACAALLGISYAPFVAVLAGQGLRAVDGRAYEAALLARGRGGAERMLFEAIRPEIAAGLLLVFVFVVSEHGVPEFLTVKGKTWHTYAEAVFRLWTRRASGVTAAELASPIVAAIPLVLLTGIALALALRFRARPTVGDEPRPLPIRCLGVWRWPALAIPLTFLGAGVGLPVLVLTRWGMGSTQRNEPMSWRLFGENARGAVDQIGSDLVQSVQVGAWTTLILVAVAVPLAWYAARRRPLVDAWATLPIAVPAVLLGIGLIKTFNREEFGAFYDTTGLLAAGYATRFLPFGVLTLSNAIRRIGVESEQAALLTGRGQLPRAWAVHGPLLLPAVWSVACLVFILALRELDLAVVLPAGNDTVVRRLSNIVHFGGEDVGGPLGLMLLGVALLAPVLTVLLTGRRLANLS
jgi:iron(III) transport system permease protein